MLCDPKHCPRIQSKLYHLALPDPSSTSFDTLLAGWHAPGSCLCDGGHACLTPPSIGTPRCHLLGTPRAASPAAQTIFAIPDVLDLILEHTDNDIQRVLAYLYVNSTTRSWAIDVLQRRTSFQPLRELVVQACSAHRLVCLRRILAILFNLDACPSRETHQSDKKPQSLFTRIFPRLAVTLQIQQDVFSHTDLSKSAYYLLRDVPRLYSADYNVDKDVFYSLACRQSETSEHARLMLIRDRANPERAAMKTGRSPLADSLDACVSFPSWASHSEHYLPLVITWMLNRGYRLRREDVRAIRRNARFEVWEGLLRLAVACNRFGDQHLLMQNATPYETERSWQIRNEEKAGCGACRKATKPRHAHRQSIANCFEPTIVEPELPASTSKRRSSLSHATEDMLNRATIMSKKWKQMLT